MIFLSSPYSHPNPLTRAERSRKAGKAMLMLAQEGILAVSPVFLGHSLEEKFHTVLPYEYWIDLDLHLMSRCNSVYVLTLPGWRESKGVRQECELAVKLSLPITGYAAAPDAEEVSGNDIRREFDLPIPKTRAMRRIT